MSCCSKFVCEGCCYAYQKREIEERLDPKCPFCRHPVPKYQAESDRNLMKRAKTNDPVAQGRMGSKCYREGDYKGAFECWTKAVELGSVQAHYQLSIMYQLGEGVKRDKKKEVHHLEQAAIGGHAAARFNLGCTEYKKSNIERAVRHFVIAAKLGDDKSLEAIELFYQNGMIRFGDLAATRRAHQASVDATKTPQREEAVANRLVVAEVAALIEREAGKAGMNTDLIADVVANRLLTRRVERERRVHLLILLMLLILLPFVLYNMLYSFA